MYTTINNRVAWIDWMKTLAMYFIIAGHCNVPGKEYIYAFSVPCFFILSGFLTKRELDLKAFWQKLWWNLVVPMLLFTAINMLYVFLKLYIQGEFSHMMLWKGPLLALFGFQGQEWNGVGLGAMWFVYSLIVCKVIYQFLPAKYNIFWMWFLSILLLILGHLINGIDTHISNNSIVNVLLAFTFFNLGVQLRPFLKEFSEVSKGLLVLVFVTGAIGVWYCGNNNEIVYLYRCSYGSDLFLCVGGSLCGTACIFALSRFFERFLNSFTKIVGGDNYHSRPSC